MSEIKIGQKRQWVQNKDIFTIINKNHNTPIDFWTLQYEDDNRKQSQTEETILSKSTLIKKLYHGTTYDNFKSILLNGFKPKIKSAWKTSDNNYMFFWDEEFISRNECFENSIGNALFTAIYNDFQGSEFVILELEVPEHICNKDHTVEWEYQKSIAIKIENLHLYMIKNVYINHNAYNKYLRWWYYCNHMCENGSVQSNFVNKELWNALIVMRDTMNYSKKEEYLEKDLYNLEKYIKIQI